MRYQGWMEVGVVAVVALACADSTVLIAPEGVGANVVAPEHQVVGSGHVQTPTGQREFTFHALKQPHGGVSGSYRIVLPNGLFFEADVTCLSVSGNRGWVGGTIRATNAAAVVVGSRSFFYAIDNGEGGATADVVSTAAFNAAAGAELAFCEDQALALAPLTVTDGNVQVR